MVGISKVASEECYRPVGECLQAKIFRYVTRKTADNPEY